MTPVICTLYSSTTSLSIQVCTRVRIESIFLPMDTCFQCQRDLLLSSSSSQTHPAVAWRWFGGNVVHAFVTSRVDYCNAILAAAPKTTTDRLQLVLNAAARVVSDTKKFDQGLSRLMHRELHRTDVPERVNYKPRVLTHRWLLGNAPVYLSNCCIPVNLASSYTAASTLRCTSSADRTSTARRRLSTYGRRAFAVAGPTVFKLCQMIYTRSCSQHTDLRSVVEDSSFLCLSARLAHYRCLT